MSQHARKSLALIQRIVATKMPAVDRLRAFEDMASRYPHRGWEEAIEETRAIVTAEYTKRRAADPDW